MSVTVRAKYEYKVLKPYQETAARSIPLALIRSTVSPATWLNGTTGPGGASAHASPAEAEINRMWQERSFSRRNFAASRLRVSPCSRPDRPLATGHDRLPGKPAQAIAQPRPGPRAAATSDSRKPGEASPRFAKIAMLETSAKLFVRPL
jgi:hypothetical protein